MGGDQEQEYFSDGISDDIITELSRFSDLFVIARNSSFQPAWAQARRDDRKACQSRSFALRRTLSSRFGYD